MTENYRVKLIEYIKKNIRKGYSIDSLKFALIQQGYAKVIVENAITEANKELAKIVPVFKEKPQIKYEVLGEDNQPIKIKKPLFKKIFRR